MRLSVCVIPAAGYGIRARPQTALTPKAMLEVNGKSVLQHTIEMLRKQLSIKRFVVITGHLGHIIQNHFGDGRNLGVSIQYRHNTEISKGLAWSIRLAEEHIDEPFLVVLGDEIYKDSNHQQLREIDLHDNLGLCGVRQCSNASQIRQNYSVTHNDKRILRLIEKPRETSCGVMGTGTFVFRPEIFGLIDELNQTDKGKTGLIEMLDRLCLAGHNFDLLWLKGDYVNINDIQALDLANRLFVQP